MQEKGVAVMKEITVISKNDVGALASITEALGSLGVNIEAVSAYERENKAVFRMVTNDVTTTMKALSRLPELHIKESNIIVIKMQNRPGELAKITRKLANGAINLESVYIVTRGQDYTEVAIKPAEQDFEKTKHMLGIK
jgi:hypothetical protein